MDSVRSMTKGSEGGLSEGFVRVIDCGMNCIPKLRDTSFSTMLSGKRWTDGGWSDCEEHRCRRRDPGLERERPVLRNRRLDVDNIADVGLLSTTKAWHPTLGTVPGGQRIKIPRDRLGAIYPGAHKAAWHGRSRRRLGSAPNKRAKVIQTPKQD